MGSHFIAGSPRIPFSYVIQIYSVVYSIYGNTVYNSFEFFRINVAETFELFRMFRTWQTMGAQH